MKKTLFILVIFIQLAPFIQAREKKPKIGLIPYSISTFSNSKRTIENNQQNINVSIEKRIKEKFDIKKKFDSKSIITYTDIEDPVVTIDPIAQPQTKKKLGELCRKYKLDGLIFGHFHEEDKLIVIFRYYDNATTKIISPPTETEVEHDILKSIDKTFDGLMSKISGLSKKEKSPKREGPDKSSSTEILTIRDVYRKIKDNCFFCMIPEDRNHKIALGGFDELKLGIFNWGRAVRSARTSNNFIDTTSISDSNCRNAQYPHICLTWNALKFSRCAHEEAEKKIKTLNKHIPADQPKWRIPTLMEAFSIIKGTDSDNYFPIEFGLPSKKSFYVWTSTQASKRKKVTPSTPTSASFYVIHYSITSKSKELTFSSVCTNDNLSEVYLLPVRSKKTPTVKSPDRINSSSYSSNSDKIPGFDYTPSQPNSHKPNSKALGHNWSRKSMSNPGNIPPAKKNKKKFVIALFPYTCSPLISKGNKQPSDLVDLNTKIKCELDKINNSSYCSLEIISIDISNRNEEDLATKFCNLIYSKNFTKLQTIPKDIKNKIMIPQNIDLIITVNYENNYSQKFFKPVLLNGIKHNHAMQAEFARNHTGFTQMIQFLQNYIRNAISKKE